MRAEESKKWREKYQEELDNMEKLYNTKLSQVREMERQTLEQYSQKVTRLEEQFGNKLQGLNRHSQYTEKEVGVRRAELELEKNEIERQKILINQMDKDLKKRQEEVDVKERTFEQRIKNEVDVYKAVTLKEISDKRDQIQIKLDKLNEELSNLAEMRRRNDTLAEKTLKLESMIEEERRVKLSYKE